MVLTATGFVNKRAIDSAVRRVEAAFAPQVVRISHFFREDSAGEPSVYFRVLVRDEAAPVERLVGLSRRLAVALMDEIRIDENGLRTYFEFRSVSEQDRLQDPAWD